MSGIVSITELCKIVCYLNSQNKVFIDFIICGKFSYQFIKFQFLMLPKFVSRLAHTKTYRTTRKDFH